MIGNSTILSEPGICSVGCAQNRAASTNRSSGVRVNEEDAVKPIGKPACLGSPGNAAVGRPEDDSVISKDRRANCSSYVGVGKGNAHKIDGRPACLADPRGASVSCS